MAYRFQPHRDGTGLAVALAAALSFTLSTDTLVSGVPLDTMPVIFNTQGAAWTQECGKMNRLAPRGHANAMAKLPQNPYRLLEVLGAVGYRTPSDCEVMGPVGYLAPSDPRNSELLGRAEEPDRPIPSCFSQMARKMTPGSSALIVVANRCSAIYRMPQAASADPYEYAVDLQADGEDVTGDGGGIGDPEEWFCYDSNPLNEHGTGIASGTPGHSVLLCHATLKMLWSRYVAMFTPQAEFVAVIFTPEFAGSLPAVVQREFRPFEAYSADHPGSPPYPSHPSPPGSGTHKKQDDPSPHHLHGGPHPTPSSSSPSSSSASLAAQLVGLPVTLVRRMTGSHVRNERSDDRPRSPPSHHLDGGPQRTGTRLSDYRDPGEGLYVKGVGDVMGAIPSSPPGRRYISYDPSSESVTVDRDAVACLSGNWTLGDFVIVSFFWCVVLLYLLGTLSKLTTT